jgi:EAL domain-containing protein (putative c-di-GMP-specific phosphodiesterase class I)
VRTIIEMGRNLEIDVIAEGVESVSQLEFLSRNGCHYAQGRLFGEPLKSEELLALLQRQAASGPAFRRYTQDSTAVAVGEQTR